MTQHNTDNSDDIVDQTASQSEPTRGSLLVIFLTVFIDLLGFGMVLPLLPIYADQFTTDPAGWQIGLLMASFSAMQFLFAPIWGNLSDRIGRRPVLMIGLVGSVVFYFLFGVATIYQSLIGLFITRIGAGIAGATIPTAQAYIADTTTPEKRTRGMALIGVAFGMGFTFGPLLGFLAVPDGKGDPGPWPGFAAAILSAIALLLAIFLLPESNQSRSSNAKRKVFDFDALRVATTTPRVLFILFAIAICIFAFANLETTFSMVLKGSQDFESSPFEFSWRDICLTYAFIGFMVAFVQGGLVRPLASHLPEHWLAISGALIEFVGFLLVIVAMYQASIAMLFVAMAVVATGYSGIQPSLHSMLSKSSTPERYGAIMGLGQSFNSMARILGSGLAIPLLKLQLYVPYAAGAVMMIIGAAFVFLARPQGDKTES